MNRIKNLRVESNMTQAELAKYLGVNPSIISHYETESAIPSKKIMIKLAKLFNCSIDYIWGISDEKNPEEELRQIRFADYGGLDVNGLSKKDLIELQKQIDYMKYRNSQKNNKKEQ